MNEWLKNFPRPPYDNGRGLHWSPNQYFWGKNEWSFWADLLDLMGIKWVKIMDDGSGSAIGLIKRLLDLKIMPVIRLYREQPNPGRINGGNLEFIKRCVDYGAPYFETNNEPDLDLEWENRKRPENWLDIVVDNFVVEASQIRDVGGYLLFPAFGPGGRGNPFQMIVEKGRKDLLDGNCCLAIHNYCLGRPLDYPNDGIADFGEQLTQEEWEEAGGMWAWEMGVETVNKHRRDLANHTIDIMNDSTCFRAFEYFDKLVNDACGHSIPIMTTEGGYNVGQRAGTTFGDDARYPKPTPFHMSQLTDDMFRYIEESAPDYYFSCMAWVAGVAAFGLGAANFENQGPWITNLYDRDWGLRGELPIVKMLKNRLASPRTPGNCPPQWNRFDRLKFEDRNIDYRIRYLEPEIMLYPITPSGQYWKLTEIKWQDAWENPSGNIFVRCLNKSGEIIEGQEFAVAHGNEEIIAKTKGEIDNGYGDVLMTAGLGTYSVFVDEMSDMISGLGMGTEAGYERTSFFLTFQLTESEDSMFDFKQYREKFLAGETDWALGYGITHVHLETRERPVARLIGVHHLTPEENNGKHHIYVEILGEDGERVLNRSIEWTWEGKQDDESAPPIKMSDYQDGDCPNIAMWANQTISLWVTGIASDRVLNIHTRHPDEPDGNNVGHHSFYIVFKIEQVQDTLPEQPEPVDDEYKRKYYELLNDIRTFMAAMAAVIKSTEGEPADILIDFLESEDDNDED